MSIHAGAHIESVGELVPLFRAELELCRLCAGDRVLVHTDTHTSPDYPAACVAATLQIGAVPIEVCLPVAIPEPTGGPIAGLWHDADLVVDMVTAGAHAYTSELNRAVDSGTRILRVAEPPDILRRLFPDPEVVRATQEGATRLRPGSAVRLTSPAGTDLTMRLGDRPGVAHYGYADQPGRWDHWPSAICITVPAIDTIDGILVLAPGDALLWWGRLVSQPIRCEIRKGRLHQIEGGAEARMIVDALSAYRDPNAYVLSIVGWGCDPRARWERVLDPFAEPGGVMDVENAAGALLLVFGSNTSVNLRGQIQSAAHMNVNCRSHTITIDGTPAVREGRLVDA